MFFPCLLWAQLPALDLNTVSPFRELLVQPLQKTTPTERSAYLKEFAFSQALTPDQKNLWQLLILAFVGENFKFSHDAIENLDIHVCTYEDYPYCSSLYWVDKNGRSQIAISMSPDNISGVFTSLTHELTHHLQYEVRLASNARNICNDFFIDEGTASLAAFEVPYRISQISLTSAEQRVWFELGIREEIRIQSGAYAHASAGMKQRYEQVGPQIWPQTFKNLLACPNSELGLN